MRRRLWPWVALAGLLCSMASFALGNMIGEAEGALEVVAVVQQNMADDIETTCCEDYGLLRRSIIIFVNEEIRGHRSQARSIATQALAATGDQCEWKTSKLFVCRER